jgi:hypothetical protein
MPSKPLAALHNGSLVMPWRHSLSGDTSSTTTINITTIINIADQHLQKKKKEKVIKMTYTCLLLQ